MKDKVKSLSRMGVKDALLSSQIGDTQCINKGKNDVVEGGQDLWGLTVADGAAIFA